MRESESRVWLLRSDDLLDRACELREANRRRNGEDAYEDGINDLLDAVCGWCHKDVAIKPYAWLDELESDL